MCDDHKYKRASPKNSLEMFKITTQLKIEYLRAFKAKRWNYKLTNELLLYIRLFSAVAECLQWFPFDLKLSIAVEKSNSSETLANQ